MIMAVKAKWNGGALLSLTLCGSLLFSACGGSKPEESPRAAAVAATPAPNPDFPTDPRRVIVAFGDSLTAGFGVEPGKSYPDDLQRLLDAAGYKYHVVNMGESGDTTTDGVGRLPDVLGAKPAIVILEFGGNDGLRGLPVSTTRANQIEMIQSLQKAGARVLLAGMTLPRNYGPDYIHSFEAVYVDIARQFHLARIPFLLEGVAGHSELIQSDGIHPTAEGCKIVSSNVMNYLGPLLER
jgi:acyl-CoA thioesterase-1